MRYPADLHIHSVLSPCADFLMGYKNIFDILISNKIKIFSITDHNSAGNSRIFFKKAEEMGLIFVPGIEVQTAEEIHVLAYFEKIENLEEFSEIIKNSLPKMKNKEEVFGYQLLLDENDDYSEKEESFLAGASDFGIDEIFEIVNKMGGIVVPAHLDRSNSILSNLGYLPNINFYAYEIYNKKMIKEISEKYNVKNILSSSDSHYLNTLGEIKMEIDILEESAKGVIDAIKEARVYLI